jgi:hypothetical protein
MKRSEAIAKTCEAIEDIRLSRPATQHAIEQSRKSFAETHALLVKLRLFYSGHKLRPLDSTRSFRRVSSKLASLPKGTSPRG